MQTDAEVAAKLTKAMRQALLSARTTETGAVRIVPRLLFTPTIHALIRRGLVFDTYVLSALGLRVAQHLKQENGK